MHRIRTALLSVSGLAMVACHAPGEPEVFDTSVEAVLLVELAAPRTGRELEVVLRVTPPDGARVELVPCTVGVERFDGQRWQNVYGDLCALGSNGEPPSWSGATSLRIRRPIDLDTPGQYRMQALVRRTGIREGVRIEAQFAITAAQVQR